MTIIIVSIIMLTVTYALPANINTENDHTYSYSNYPPDHDMIVAVMDVISEVAFAGGDKNTLLAELNKVIQILSVEEDDIPEAYAYRKQALLDVLDRVKAVADTTGKELVIHEVTSLISQIRSQ